MPPTNLRDILSAGPAKPDEIVVLRGIIFDGDKVPPDLKNEINKLRDPLTRYQLARLLNKVV